MRLPKVSCIMPTKGRPEFLDDAAECFLRQDYRGERELIIVADRDSDCAGAFGNIQLPQWQVSIYWAGPGETLGEKRNRAVRFAQGDIIAHFDDDDYSAPGRLTDQVGCLLRTGMAVTGYHEILFRETRQVQVIDENGRRTASEWWLWQGNRSMVAGSSLCYFRQWAIEHPFEAVQLGEDDRFYAVADERGMAISARSRHLMYCTNHAGSVSQRTVCAASPEWLEMPRGPV